MKIKQSGTSLMEVLVASFIFSIALLGVGTCMLRAEQTLRQSYLRTQALALVSSMAETTRVMKDYVEDKSSLGHQILTETCLAPLIYAQPQSQADKKAAFDKTIALESILKGYEKAIFEHLPNGHLILDRRDEEMVIKVVWDAADNQENVALNVYLG